METSIFIAKIFGLTYLILGIGFLVNRKAFLAVMDDYLKNAALSFYGGVMALVVGIVLILTHNVWVSDWRVVITLIGWMGLIKGIWIIMFPNSISGFMKLYKQNENMVTAHLLLALLLGGVLTYYGFYAG